MNSHNHKKADIEEQITSMLEKVMRDDIEEYDTNTIDTSLDHSVSDQFPNELRKQSKKSKTQANHQFTYKPGRGGINLIHENGFNLRDSPTKKSNTVNMQCYNPMIHAAMISSKNSLYMDQRSNNLYLQHQPQPQLPQNLLGRTFQMQQPQPQPQPQQVFFNNGFGIFNNNNWQGNNYFPNGNSVSGIPFNEMKYMYQGNSNININNVNNVNNVNNTNSNNNFNSNNFNMSNSPYKANPDSPNKRNSIFNFKANDNENSNEANNLSDTIFNELERMLSISEKIDEKLFSRLKGNFISIIKTQNGSRVFQKYLKNTSSLILRSIFNEIRYDLNDLIIDPYANYFCQKFFGFLEQQEKLIFLKEVNLRLNLD
jgi:hypothetical protein